MGDASNACRERSRERQSTRHSMIFVDIAKGRDTNDGSMSMPVLTVKRALQLLVELNPDEKVLKAQEFLFAVEMWRLLQASSMFRASVHAANV